MGWVAATSPSTTHTAGLGTALGRVHVLAAYWAEDTVNAPQAHCLHMAPPLFMDASLSQYTRQAGTAAPS